MNELNLTFQLSRTEIFEVSYKTIGSNASPYFSTSAAVFNRPKTDFNRCGQCQDDVLKTHRAAMRFYKKWDPFHLHDLTPKQYKELVDDIETLKDRYNWCSGTSFCEQRALSMQNPKKA